VTEEERLALGERRKLVFENIANGVPAEQVMQAFRLSREEVDREVAFVAKKITEYRFQRREPPLSCGNVPDIRFNRQALLDTLRKLGPKYMSSALLLPSVKIQKLDSPGMLKEASQRAGIKVRQ
jgi:hypothetical protein